MTYQQLRGCRRGLSRAARVATLILCGAVGACRSASSVGHDGGGAGGAAAGAGGAAGRGATDGGGEAGTSTGTGGQAGAGGSAGSAGNAAGGQGGRAGGLGGGAAGTAVKADREGRRGHGGRSRRIGRRRRGHARAVGGRVSAAASGGAGGGQGGGAAAAEMRERIASDRRRTGDPCWAIADCVGATSTSRRPTKVLRHGLHLQLRRGRHLWHRCLSATEAVFGGRQRRVPRLPAALHRRQQLRLWLDVHQRRTLPAAQLRWGRHVPVGFRLGANNICTPRSCTSDSECTAACVKGRCFDRPGRCVLLLG